MNSITFAVRQLRRSPAFTATAAITLALGVGTNTTMFSVVDAVLLRPLPYDNPGPLVQVWEATGTGRDNSVSAGVFAGVAPALLTMRRRAWRPAREAGRRTDQGHDGPHPGTKPCPRGATICDTNTDSPGLP